MATRLTIVALLLCCWVTGASGQTLIVYVPPEGDFRALFPAPPARTSEAQGAVAFTARAGDVSFTVYRRDPARQPIDNPAVTIRQRLTGGNEDRGATRVGKDEGAGGELVFITRGVATIHRVIAADGRYYELVVGVPREDLKTIRRTARDFFGSFQVGSAPVAAGPVAAVTPDVLCKGRSNALSRMYCEYSSCLKSQYRGQPYCQKLLGLL